MGDKPKLSLEDYMNGMRAVGMSFTVGERELQPGTAEYDEALRDFCESVPPESLSPELREHLYAQRP
ncbi:MAG TPA: hypothetical protein VJP60_05495 [Rhizomicrobium sp.]|nr:hypothetical protein [Rhizomicrobium sp.]